jgi:hypothetical protein
MKSLWHMWRVFSSLGLAIRKQGSPSGAIAYMFHLFDVNQLGWKF